MTETTPKEPRAETQQPEKRASIRKTLFRALRWGLALFAVFAALAVAEAWKSLGHRAEGERRARMERSPQWHDGHFENPEPLANDLVGALEGMMHTSPDVSPSKPIPVDPIDPKRFATDPPSGLRVTWFGHSSMFIEIDGRHILTDPVWSERPSPVSWAGPKRWYSVPIALEAFPKIDAVLISHDHYDHLDYRTIVAMKDWATTFIVPLGIGAHLEYWGVPVAHIREVDWWDETVLGDLRIVCTPARHASGRQVFDQDAKLWASYSIIGSKHRAFFSGDTGLFPAMKDIGEKLGPFDVTMIETGQYHSSWPDWHIGPEQAVGAHVLLHGKVFFPMHWGVLALAYHSWTEPVERVLVAAEAAGAKVVTPKPGESVEPEAPPAVTRWWPKVTWQSAHDGPIRSTLIPAAMAGAMPYASP